MPELVYRWVLPIGTAVFGAMLLVKRAYVTRLTGRDPVLVRPFRELETPHGLIELAAGAGGVAMVADIGVNAALRDAMLAALGIPVFRGAVAWVGLALLAVGSAVIAAAIVAMGTSWRIGIDRDAPGALVTTGIFSLVRHPIYAGMFAVAIGLALVNGEALALIIAAAGAIALPIQARLEEAFLDARYPRAYDAYMRRTGRFVPGVGRRAGGG